MRLLLLFAFSLPFFAASGCLLAAMITDNGNTIADWLWTARSGPSLARRGHFVARATS